MLLPNMNDVLSILSLPFPLKGSQTTPSLLVTSALGLLMFVNT